MKIDLDGIELDNTEEQATGDIHEGRCVSNINTSDQRNVASVDVPGGQGSSHNDLGRSAVVVTFDGTIFGENAGTLIESIRSKFKAGDPVPFVSDLSGSADITKVIIGNFVVNDVAGAKDRFDYSIVLKEYKEPPEEPRAPEAAGEGKAAGEEEAGETPADGEAKEWSDDIAGDSEDSVNNLTGKVLDADGNPKKGVTVSISGDDGEHSVVTDDEGAYKLEDVPPGTYKASVDDDEYSGIEETITVGGSGGGASGGEGEGEDTGDAGEDSSGDGEGEDSDTGTEDTGSGDADGEDSGDSETEEQDGPSDDSDEDTGDDGGEDSGEAAEDTDSDTNTDDDTDTETDTGSDPTGDEDTDTGDTDSEEGDTDEDPDSVDGDQDKKTSWGF